MAYTGGDSLNICFKRPDIEGDSILKSLNIESEIGDRSQQGARFIQCIVGFNSHRSPLQSSRTWDGSRNSYMNNSVSLSTLTLYFPTATTWICKPTQRMKRDHLPRTLSPPPLPNMSTFDDHNLPPSPSLAVESALSHSLHSWPWQRAQRQSFSGLP